MLNYFKKNKPVLKYYLPAIIFILALTLRILHIIVLRHTPYTLNPGLDSKYYIEWANHIVSGNIMGKGAFFGAPLYPYMLSLFFSLFGQKLFIIRILQALIDSLSAVILFFIVFKTIKHKLTAFLSAILYACYHYLIFQQELILTDTLGIFLQILSLYFIILSAQKEKLLFSFLAGCLVGLSALARTGHLLLFPVGLIYLFMMRSSLKISFYKTALFITGFLIFIIPCTVRNWIVEKEFILIDASGGVNFYIGNNPYSNGTFTVDPFPRALAASPNDLRMFFKNMAEETTQHAMSAKEVSSFWFSASKKHIQAEPQKWLKLIARKTQLLFNSKEMSDTQNYYLTKEYSFVLKWLFIPFGVICPLALIGFALTLRNKKFIFIHSVFLLYVFGLLMIFINSRYRMVLLPFIFIYASSCLSSFIDFIKERKFKDMAIITLSFFLIFFWMKSNSSLIVEIPYTAYYNLGNRYYGLGNISEAIRLFKISISQKPEYIKPHNNLAIAYEQLKMTEEALKEWETVKKLSIDIKSKSHYETSTRHINILKKISSKK